MGGWRTVCQCCGEGCGFFCPGEVRGSVGFWCVIDRPHRVGGWVSVTGPDGNWVKDDYGGWSQRYCWGGNPMIRIAAFSRFPDGAVAEPTVGPWGSHSVDVDPSQGFLITDQAQGLSELSRFVFRITISYDDLTGLVSADSTEAEIHIRRQSPADVIPDGVVNALDLGAVISGWGLDPFGRAASDINLDGRTDGFDLGEVLFKWGTPG